MVSPMVVLYIILGIFALIGLILAIPLGICLRYTTEDGFQFKLKVAGITLVDSAKEKPEKPEEDPTPRKKQDKKQKKDSKKSKEKKNSSAVSGLMNFLGLGDIASVAKAKKALEQKGLTEMLADVSTAVGKIFARIGQLIARGVFKHFTLRIIVGDEDAADAAMTYGRICGIIYPLVTMLDSAMNFRRRTVDLRCDFNEENTAIDFDGHLQYRPWHFVLFLGGLIINYFKRSVK